MRDEIQLLHMILKNCFGNIFVIDKDANIVYVNDNAANALGLPAEELMRMSAYELLDRKLASSVAALKVLETKQEHIQAVTFANGNTMAVNARPVLMRMVISKTLLFSARSRRSSSILCKVFSMKIRSSVRHYPMCCRIQKIMS